MTVPSSGDATGREARRERSAATEPMSPEAPSHDVALTDRVHSRRRPSLLTLLAFAAALLWGFFASLGTVRIPLGALWVPTVVSTAWAHIWSVLGVCVALGAILFWRKRRPASRLGTVTVILLAGSALAALAPLARQKLAASDLPVRLTESFGSALPREAEGAPARRSMVAPAAWFGESAPEVQTETLEFARRGEGPPLLLDLYQRSDTPIPRPLVVMVHGGSWQRGVRSEYPALNRYLAARGYAVADIDYRLAPAHLFPAPIEDLHDALRFLVERAEEFGLDRHRIAIIGRSAGGHIALTGAYTAREKAQVAVAGVVAFYAPTDMVWSWEKSLDLTYIDGKKIVETYMGGPPESDPARFRDASPIHLATATSPATLLIHGARDRLVSPEQSTRLAAQLETLGVPHLHLELPSATHGFDVAFGGPGAQISTYAIERFLASVLDEE